MYQQIRLDAGGSLVFDPPQDGRPDSATYILYAVDGSTEIAASVAATIDPVNTTLTAPAAVGDTTITVDSTTGLVIGRRFLLKALADGEVEWRTVAAFTSSLVTLDRPILHGYATSDTFQGTQIVLPVAAGDADDLDRGFEARLTYEVNALTYVVSVYYDVVRQPWPEVILRSDEFAVYAGSLSSRALQRTAALGFSSEIATATTLLREELLDRGMRPDLFRGFDGFKRSVALLVIAEWADEGVNVPSVYQSDPDLWADKARGRYQQAIGRALNTVQTYDENDDESIDDDERDVRRGSFMITR